MRNNALIAHRVGEPFENENPTNIADCLSHAAKDLCSETLLYSRILVFTANKELSSTIWDAEML